MLLLHVLPHRLHTHHHSAPGRRRRRLRRHRRRRRPCVRGDIPGVGARGSGHAITGGGARVGAGAGATGGGTRDGVRHAVPKAEGAVADTGARRVRG
eukprot:scaffold4950_cov99-Isochrysis_galbana.AAC.1